MATVDFKVKNIKAANGTTATLAEVQGSIDATSIGQFQTIMDKLVEKGIKNLILDCSQVKYINSTGLGTLLKYVDTFESAGGHMAFTRVPSKVMLVMEMLGFNALFNIQEDENAALASFGGGGAEAAPAPASAEPAPAPAVAPAPASPPAAAASPVAASPLPARARVATPAPAPASAPAPAQAPAGTPMPAVSFPLQVQCTRCLVTLEVANSGKFRCPRCATILQVEPNGRVRFFASKKMKPVQVVLPTHPQILDSITGIVESVAQHLGFNGDAVGAMADSVRQTAHEMASAAYGADSSRIFHVLVVPEKRQLTVRLADQGKPLEFAQGNLESDPRFSSALQTMDMVQHESGNRGGNVVTMTKRVD